MKIVLIASLSFLLGMAQRCAADNYIWEGGPTGDFSSMTGWIDVTTPGSGGTPGAGDSADASGADMTFESGSVMELQGESATFDFEGQFSAGLVQGNETIIGSGQLNANMVIASLDLEGGNVFANSFVSSETEVDSGGSLTVSGLLKDQRYLECSGIGSTISAQSGMTDVSLVLNAGGKVTTAGIFNLLGAACTLQGSAAVVSDTADLDLAEGATLDVFSGASLQVANNANLDGGTNISDGGATLSDPQTAVQVNGVLNIGYKHGSFFMSVLNGAQLTSAVSYIGAAGSKGYVTLSGTNTVWNVQTGGLEVGSGSPGSLTINTGAGLTFGGDLPLGIGFGPSAPGTLVLDGQGSYINGGVVAVSIGLTNGSQGSAQVVNQSTMTASGDFYVGDGGLGTLTLDTGAKLSINGNQSQFGVGHSSGGNGTVDILDAAALTVAGYTTVGDAGSGILSIAQGGLLSTSGTTVGNANGSSGSARVAGSGSDWVETNQLLVGSELNSTGVVSVTSGGQFQIFGDCFIGGSGKGTFSVESGGSCVILPTSNGRFGLGIGSQGNGLLTVSDTNSVFTVVQPVVIGSLGAGTVVVTNGGSVFTDTADLADQTGSTGTVNITGPGSSWVAVNNFYVGGRFDDQPAGYGNLVVQNSGTFRARPLFYVSATGVVSLDSTGQIAVGKGPFGAPGTFSVSQGGKLFGKGTIHGQVVIGAGGSFVPGGSPGIFTVDGNFQQEAGGEMDIFIGGTAPGSGFSQVNITGTATLGGTLNIILMNGYTPAPGQTFSFLNAAAASGTFAQVNGASITYGVAGATLSNVTGATGTPQLSIQAEGQNVVVSWPQTVQGYSLQTSPTLASNSWSTVAADENTYVAPIAGPPAFFRLIH